VLVSVLRSVAMSRLAEIENSSALCNGELSSVKSAIVLY
jgi:hypothetical protein